MLDTELKQIIEITNKATKAPWTSYIEGRDHTSGSNFIMTGVEEDRDYDIDVDRLREEDQDFIAMARNTLPQLVDEILRLQKILNDNSIPF
ncbi:hypothetical protein AM493_08955 [Flavobacterium akiainvivens]|uniref:Uncharacterized protein n=1 Tax=Flavobacterium akiainvivens TaxID=1202724 RepID=A0A0M9VI04_9FLAO|nr:hypothetical protein [Flavobacterium akiainvivens]KOS06146.1 hypothetical protein AM493_08955 [Flavobacterium akiainvivens]SFQ67913.1 hypothetical protein SAMN05444144_11425 [Flavobacterium akiainvivens]